MTFIEKLKTLERIDQLVRMKATGSAKDLANRLGVSERCVFDIISTFKQLEAPISYCRTSNSYVYQKESYFSYGFFESKKIETMKIKGGFNFYSENISHCNFFAAKDPTFIQG